MSILASAGRAKIYNTDGTGRDTYVSNNSGGFAIDHLPASAWRGGTFAVPRQVSPEHVARGGGQGSPGKTIRYQVNGTGRDSYIHATHGGFASNYTWMNDQEAYVKSLRGYPESIQMQQRAVYTNSKKSPNKDHFVEGQCSLRSPKARNDLRMLKTCQRMQAERLSMPKRVSSINEMAQTMGAAVRSSHGQNAGNEESPRGNFLRKTTLNAATTSRNAILSRSMQRNQLTQLTSSFEKQAIGEKLTTNSLRNMLTAHRTVATGSKNRYKSTAKDILIDQQLDAPINGQEAVSGRNHPMMRSIEKPSKIAPLNGNGATAEQASMRSSFQIDNELNRSFNGLDTVRILNGNTHDVHTSNFQKKVR